MSSNITLRLIGMLLFAAAGLFLGSYLSPGDTSDSFNLIALPLVGALFGVLVIPYLTVYPIRAISSKLRAMPALDLVSGVLGLIVGAVLGALFSWPLSLLPGWLGQVAPTVVAAVFAFIGVSVGLLRKRELLDTLRGDRDNASAGNNAEGRQTNTSPRLTRMENSNGHGVINAVTQPRPSTERLNGPERIQIDKYLLVDTSAIIDGRIADISRTGFIDGILLVPRFVLNELQHIADSPDPLRRARGRRGLDILHRLQVEAVVPVQVSEVDAEDIDEVDGKLVKIARFYHCPVITNDFNLNRVAEIQGVKVLNINELANAIKPMVLPGEEMHVQVVQEGKELGQGVAYLDDGTMVVVENGKKHMHSEVDVVVTRVLQTVAGRMIFANMKNGRA